MEYEREPIYATIFATTFVPRPSETVAAIMMSALPMYKNVYSNV